MPRQELKELNQAVNEAARRHYPAIARMTGIGNFVSDYLPRYALRDTLYPYKLSEADSFYSDAPKSLGKVVFAGRDEGLQAIHAANNTQVLEHAWAYVPQADCWIDKTVSATNRHVTGDPNLVAYLTHLFPEVQDVHTHPDVAIKNLAQPPNWRFDENYLAEAALPSADDMVSHIQIAARCNPISKLVSSVVSHYGITSFTDTTELETYGGLLVVGAFDWTFEMSTNPVDDIRRKLGELSATRVACNFDTPLPAFQFQFEPLAAA